MYSIFKCSIKNITFPLKQANLKKTQHTTVSINYCFNFHFSPLKTQIFFYFIARKSGPCFLGQPFVTEAESDVTASATDNELKKNLSIFMPQTSINVFYVWRRRVFWRDRDNNTSRYVCPFSTPYSLFLFEPMRALATVGGE